MTSNKLRIPAHLTLGHGSETVPIGDFWRALGEIAEWPIAPSRTHADLTLYAMPDLVADADCWYELWWTHPSVAMVLSEDDADPTAYVDLVTVQIERVATLPAPRQIPVELRLAAAEPVEVGPITDADRRFFGPDAAALKREWFEGRRDDAIRNDRRASTIDWAAYTAEHIDRFTALPPSLTPGQRAAAAFARYRAAFTALHGARESVIGMLSNAVAAGDLEPVADLDAVITALDPSLAAEKPVRDALSTLPRTPAAKPGRQKIGSQISVIFPPELLARVDDQSDRDGVHRAAWLRRAVEAELARTATRVADSPVISMYEDNAGSVYIERGGVAWDLGPVTADLVGAAEEIGRAWHTGQWAPSESEGQSRARVDALNLIAVWTPEDGLTIEREQSGQPVAGAGGKTFLGLTD